MLTSDPVATLAVPFTANVAEASRLSVTVASTVSNAVIPIASYLEHQYVAALHWLIIVLVA